MTDLKQMFGIDDHDCDCFVARCEHKELEDTIEEICAGLLVAGCVKDDLFITHYPNAPERKTEISIKDTVKYKIVWDHT